MSESNILCVDVIVVPDQIIADNVQISNPYIVEALSHETIDIDINNDSLLHSLTPPPLPPPPPRPVFEHVWAQNDVEANSILHLSTASGGTRLRPSVADPISSSVELRVFSETTSRPSVNPSITERPETASGYSDLRSPSELVVQRLPGTETPLTDVENEVEEPSPNATVQQTSALGSPPPLPKYTLCCNLCMYLTTFYCIIFVVLIITLLILFL